MWSSTPALYILLIFAWSTSWLPLSWQVGVVAPEVSLFWRFLLAAPIMWFISYRSGARLRPVLTELPAFMALGLFIFGLNFTLFYYGSVGVASGMLAVMFSSASLINLFLDALRTRKLPATGQVLAAIIGILGISFLYAEEIMRTGQAWLSLMLCVLGTLSFCLGNQVSAHLQRQHIPVMTANSWGMLFGALWLFLISLARGHEFIMEPTAQYVGGLIYLSLFSTILAFSCYLTLVGRIGAGKAAYATVVFPVFALLISSLFEGYNWTLFSFIGIGCVVLGNFLMVRQPAR